MKDNNPWNWFADWKDTAIILLVAIVFAWLFVQFIPSNEKNESANQIGTAYQATTSEAIPLSPFAPTSFAPLATPSHTMSFDDEVLSRVNAVRAQKSLPPLKANPLLTVAARDKVQDMIANHYYAHQSPTGVSFTHWFAVVGYVIKNGGLMGENLADGIAGTWTPQTMVTAWVNSPSHYANMIQAKYTETGIYSQSVEMTGTWTRENEDGTMTSVNCGNGTCGTIVFTAEEFGSGQ